MMPLLRILLIFSLFIFSVTMVKAEGNSVPDSLQQELQKPYHDTVKFELLLTIGDFYEYSQPDIAMAYYINAKELAEKNLEEPNRYERKFLQQKAKAIRYIAYVYQNQGDMNTALEHYLQALAIGESINCNLNIYNSYNNIGIINHIQKDYHVARDYYEKAIEITEKTGNKVGRAKLFINMGILNHDLASEADNISEKQLYFQAALDNYSNALIIKIEYNDIKGQSLCHENMGNVYKEIAKITVDSGQRSYLLE